MKVVNKKCSKTPAYAIRDLLQINIFILSYAFSFNIFINLSLFFHIITPIGHVEVTDHVICPFYPYVIYR